MHTRRYDHVPLEMPVLLAIDDAHALVMSLAI